MGVLDFLLELLEECGLPHSRISKKDHFVSVSFHLSAKVELDRVMDKNTPASKLLNTKRVYYSMLSCGIWGNFCIH